MRYKHYKHQKGKSVAAVFKKWCMDSWRIDPYLIPSIRINYFINCINNVDIRSIYRNIYQLKYLVAVTDKSPNLSSLKVKTHVSDCVAPLQEVIPILALSILWFHHLQNVAPHFSLGVIFLTDNQKEKQYKRWHRQVTENGTHSVSLCPHSVSQNSIAQPHPVERKVGI